MIKYTSIIASLVLCSTLAIAQPSSKSSSQTTTSDLNESVKRAREQEAAYQQAQLKNPNEKPLAKVGAKLPAFQVITASEESMFDTDLDKKKPLVLVLFNPSCGHCVDVAKAFKDSIDKVKGATVLFVTAKNQLGEIAGFVETTGVKHLKHFYVSAENTELNKYLFEYNGMPQIMIYNKEKILQKTFYKYAEMDSISHYIKKAK